MDIQSEKGVYVFDTGPLRQLFGHFDLKVFPDLWAEFHRMLVDGRILSVREVRREIFGPDNLLEWVDTHKAVFLAPDDAQTEFMQEMLANQHAQGLIEQKKFKIGGGAADPFIIALARVRGGCVVTTEKYRPNAPKIPTLCEQFDIPCVDLTGFMKREGWKFVREQSDAADRP